jgi:hypothetical protein
MRDFLNPVEAVKVETNVGVIYVSPTSGKTVTVNAILELAINPDLTPDNAFATLARWRMI